MKRHGIYWFHQWAQAVTFATARAAVTGRRHRVTFGRTSLLWMVVEA